MSLHPRYPGDVRSDETHTVIAEEGDWTLLISGTPESPHDTLELFPRSGTGDEQNDLLMVFDLNTSDFWPSYDALSRAADNGCPETLIHQFRGIAAMHGVIL